MIAEAGPEAQPASLACMWVAISCKELLYGLAHHPCSKGACDPCYMRRAPAADAKLQRDVRKVLDRMVRRVEKRHTAAGGALCILGWHAAKSQVPSSWHGLLNWQGTIRFRCVQ